MGAITLSKHQLYGLLKSYHWKIKEIKRMKEELDDTEFTGTAGYGIEATMPSAKGGISRALETEVLRRCKKQKRLRGYVDEVNYINSRTDLIQDERQKAILDCMLDGMSMTAIAKHLKMSRTWVNKVQDEIVEILGE